MEEIPVLLKKGGLSLILNILTVLFLIGATLIATRKLDPEDYGLYQLILNLTQYAWIVLSIDTFFSTRQIARGNNIVNESIKLGAAIILPECLIFGIIFYFLTSIFELNFYLIILSVIYVLVFLLSFLFNSIIIGQNVVNYYIVTFIQSVSRFFTLLILLYLIYFPISVEMFIIALIISILLQFPYYIKEIRKLRNLKNSLRLSQIIKDLWFYPLISSVVFVASTNDTVFMGILLASTLPIAFFRVAYFVSNSINYVQSISNVYYREFVEKGDLKIFEQAVKTNVLYTTLVCFLIVGEGNLLIYIFRPVYSQAYIASILLAFSFVFLSLSSLFSYALVGFEREEIETLRKRFKTSNFYHNFKVDLFSLILQYSLLSILAYFSKTSNLQAYSIAIYWSSIWLVTSIFSFSYRLRTLKKKYNFKFPLNNVIRYLLASFFAGIIVFYLRPVAVNGPLYYQIGIALLYAIVYLAIYLPILLLIEKNIRKRVFTILRSFKFLLQFKISEK